MAVLSSSLILSDVLVLSDGELRDAAALASRLAAMLGPQNAGEQPRGHSFPCLLLACVPPDRQDGVQACAAALNSACEACGLPRPGEARLLAAALVPHAVFAAAAAELGRLGARRALLLMPQEGTAQNGSWELWLLERGRDTARAARLALVPECHADGVFYARLDEGECLWRMGATVPGWREELLAAGRVPLSPEAGVRDIALHDLGQRGVWLAEDRAAPPLAVMCCGQGAVWTGMGRQLYDRFPAARAAMDRIAAVADWDVLSLMDETDEEKIGLTRWQQPYLFLLEYAQWSYLASLGLRPALICGHSLGELIALCLAGVYAPEVAWYILDTRAQHMSELEARATRETAMMAVHAEASVIDEARARWPSLYVSNYNTPLQHIVSGPRDVLMEARKALRKRRIPAIMLNVSLAFHHPGMRVLRDMSLRRLNALAMQAPQVPMLSCVTTGFYPQSQPDICSYIADLDENAVRWVECVRQMWQRDGIRHFVELGPQDTLCGLVADIEPQALCLSASRKGRETEGLRQTCARLYALGHLSHQAVMAHAARWQLRGAVAEDLSAPAVAEAAPATPLGPLARRIMELLAQTAGVDVASVGPQTDLRYDLALRSSRFPLLVQQLAEVLGHAVNFEDLMGVSTVGDLLAAVGLMPRHGAPAAAAVPLPAGSREAAAALHQPPYLRFAASASSRLHRLPWDACAAGRGWQPGGAVLAWGRDGARLAALLGGLAALGQVICVPEDCLEACAVLRRLGGDIRSLGCAAADLLPAEAAAAETGDHAAVAALRAALATALHTGCAASLPVSGCLLDLSTADDQAALGRVARTALLPPEAADAWLVRVWQLDAGDALAMVQAVPAEVDDRLLDVALVPDGTPPLPREWGDMLARELALGTVPRLLWARAASLCGLLPLSREEADGLPQPWQERPESFPGLYAASLPLPPHSGRDFLLCGEFSRFAEPTLAGHGRDTATGWPWLPLSRGLRRLLDSVRLYFPWLREAGFCDLRFGPPLLLPPGVTRECRLDVRAQAWLQQDGVMTRMCRCGLEALDLMPNGRHMDRTVPVVQGMALMGCRPSCAPALWPAGASAADPAHGDDAAVLAMYRRRGLDAMWHWLAGELPPGAPCEEGGDMAGQGLTRRFALHMPGIAPKDLSGYTAALQLVDAVEQAAVTLLEERLSRTAQADSLAEWRLSGVGFLRFGQGEGPVVPRVLEMRCGWQDGRLLRFDAQVLDAAGRALLTVNQMEFERTAAAREAACT